MSDTSLVEAVLDAKNHVPAFIATLLDSVATALRERDKRHDELMKLLWNAGERHKTDCDENATLRARCAELEKAEQEGYCHSLKIADVVNAGLTKRIAELEAGLESICNDEFDKSGEWADTAREIARSLLSKEP